MNRKNIINKISDKTYKLKWMEQIQNVNDNIKYYYNYKTFSIYYCLYHDDCCLIEGHSIPKNFELCGSNYHCVKDGELEKYGEVYLYENDYIETDFNIEDLKYYFRRHGECFEIQWLGQFIYDIYGNQLDIQSLRKFFISHI